MPHASSYSYDRLQQATYIKKQISDIDLPFNTKRMKTTKMMMMKRARMAMKKLQLKKRLKEQEQQLLKLQKRW